MGKNHRATERRLQLPYGKLTASFRADDRNLELFKKEGGISALSALGPFVEAKLLYRGKDVPLGQVGSWPIGTTPTFSFHPLEILYHKLVVTDTYDCSYMQDSGIYRNALNPLTSEISGNDLNQFIQGIVAGDPSQATNLDYATVLRNASDTTASIVVKYQCYVVVQLFSSDYISFQAGQPAIKTVNDCTDYYYALHHVDANGGVGGAQAPVLPACRIFYFSVEDPDKNRPSDQFNLYLQAVKPGVVDTTQIDPFIKNRGNRPGIRGKKK